MARNPEVDCSQGRLKTMQAHHEEQWAQIATADQTSLPQCGDVMKMVSLLQIYNKTGLPHSIISELVRKCSRHSAYDLENVKGSSAKCILVTGSLWEYLRVVGPECQGGQIPEYTGLTPWPSGTPRSTWERRRQLWECRPQAWEHMGTPATSLGAPMSKHGTTWECWQQV